MRGRTLNDAFVILDEAQNTTSEQMKMFLTRLGFGSKAVVTGDITQIDLPTGRDVRPGRGAERRQGHRGHRASSTSTTRTSSATSWCSRSSRPTTQFTAGGARAALRGPTSRAWRDRTRHARDWSVDGRDAAGARRSGLPGLAAWLAGASRPAGARGDRDRRVVPRARDPRAQPPLSAARTRATDVLSFPGRGRPPGPSTSATGDRHRGVARPAGARGRASAGDRAAGAGAARPAAPSRL